MLELAIQANLHFKPFIPTVFIAVVDDIEDPVRTQEEWKRFVSGEVPEGSYIRLRDAGAYGGQNVSIIVVSEPLVHIRARKNIGNKITASKRRMRRCKELEKAMWAEGRWQPERINVSGEWASLNCWDGTTGIEWPNHVCKGWYWQVDPSEEKSELGSSLFLAHAITYAPPLRQVSPIITLPKAPPTHLTQRAVHHAREIHRRTCDHNTPILVYLLSMAGWGNELTCVLTALAQAIRSNRTLLLLHAESTSLNSLSRYSPNDIFPLSTCQIQHGLQTKQISKMKTKHLLGNIGFRNVTYFSRDTLPSIPPVPPEAYGSIGVFQWYRILARLFLHPTPELSQAVVTSVLEAGDPMLIPKDKHISINVEDIARKIGRDDDLWGTPGAESFVERFVKEMGAGGGLAVGMQVRIGDACGFGSTCTSKQRPRHCIRELEPYLDVLLERGLGNSSMFLATDSSEVLASAAAVRADGEAPYDTFSVFFNDFSRGSYDKGSGGLIELKKDKVDDFLEEILVDLVLLSSAPTLVGSFYSNVPRISLLMGTSSSFVSFDSMWCVHFGCSIFRKPWWETGINGFVRELGYGPGAQMYAESGWKGKPTMDLTKIHKLLSSLTPPKSFPYVFELFALKADCPKSHAGLKNDAPTCAMKTKSALDFLSEIGLGGSDMDTGDGRHHSDRSHYEKVMRALQETGKFGLEELLEWLAMKAAEL